MPTEPTTDGTTSPMKLFADCNNIVGENGNGCVTIALRLMYSVE